MKEISVLGIDLAKKVFQLHGVDSSGRAVLKKKISRSGLKQFVVQLPPCFIAMEACSGSNYWARVFQSMGHEVKLIAPQFVKPFVKSNKNDAADAEAITEAAQRPQMRFVAVKSSFHQNIQALHRIRSRIVRNRVALTNEIHGLLHEYGIVLPILRTRFLVEISMLLSAEDDRITDDLKSLLQMLVDELHEMEKKLVILNQKVKRIGDANETCKRLQEIPGVGPLIATAMLASVVDAKLFKNGRQLSAWLGLVPKQNSSGGKEKLLGISKRGDPYLRQIIIHGARTVVYHSGKKSDKLNTWIQAKEKTRGRNKTGVAVANRSVRIMWALMAKGENYRTAA